MTWVASFWRENRGVLIFLAIIAIAFMTLRSQPTQGVDLDTFESDVASRPATVAYFYSNA